MYHVTHKEKYYAEAKIAMKEIGRLHFLKSEHYWSD